MTVAAHVTTPPVHPSSCGVPAVPPAITRPRVRFLRPPCRRAHGAQGQSVARAVTAGGRHVASEEETYPFTSPVSPQTREREPG